MIDMRLAAFAQLRSVQLAVETIELNLQALPNLWDGAIGRCRSCFDLYQRAKWSEWSRVDERAEISFHIFITTTAHVQHTSNRQCDNRSYLLLRPFFL